MEDEVEETVQPVTKYKEDVNAFSAPVDGYGTDYISGMPSEILNSILSYLILDHDPERGVKKHKVESQFRAFHELPHVLLSLSAMSHHFQDHIEVFARLHLTAHKDVYRFKTTAERDEEKKVRRSERLKEKSVTIARCYRCELVRHLQHWCFGCNGYVTRRAVMANGVACCGPCEWRVFPGQMSLSDALKQFDLRDWMLIATRKPGPRAKHTNLPAINYGTVRVPKPYLNGNCTSFRFFRKDVEMLAKAVHGDVQAHMRVKNDERWQRKLQKRDKEYRKLKADHHRLMLRDRRGAKNLEYHQKRLDFYEDPNCEEGYNSDDDIVDLHYASDGYENTHKRFCIDDFCDVCDDMNMRKYSPLWR